MKTLSITAKCSDMFGATLIDNTGKIEGEMNGYVPKWFPNPRVQHFGDYVELVIDIDTGKIVNWEHPDASQLNDTFNLDRECSEKN